MVTERVLASLLGAYKKGVKEDLLALTLSERIDEKASNGKIAANEAIQELAKEKPLSFRQHSVQAFSGQNLIARDRCRRCRFGPQ